MYEYEMGLHAFVRALEMVDVYFSIWMRIRGTNSEPSFKKRLSKFSRTGRCGTKHGPIVLDSSQHVLSVLFGLGIRSV